MGRTRMSKGLEVTWDSHVRDTSLWLWAAGMTKETRGKAWLGAGCLRGLGQGAGQPWGGRGMRYGCGSWAHMVSLQPVPGGACRRMGSGGRPGREGSRAEGDWGWGRSLYPPVWTGLGVPSGSRLRESQATSPHVVRRTLKGDVDVDLENPG